MKTTPIYALPFPELADTPDVPRDVQALATRVEAVLNIANQTRAMTTGTAFNTGATGIAVPVPNFTATGRVDGTEITHSAGKFTVAKSGLYLVTGAALWAAVPQNAVAGFTRRRTYIQVNGTTSFLIRDEVSAPNMSYNGDTWFQVSGLLSLAANDYVQLTTYQTTGFVQSVTSASLSIAKLTA